MIFPASSDCLQRAGWGAATLKLADFIFVGLKDMLLLCSSKCDRKKQWVSGRFSVQSPVAFSSRMPVFFRTWVTMALEAIEGYLSGRG